MVNSPSKFFLKFFKWVCDPEIHANVEGDLLELYRERYLEQGRAKADIKFIRDVLFLIRPEIINAFRMKRSRTPGRAAMGTMLRHYFTITYRSLLKHSFYSFINIFGLAIGMLAFVMIMLYVEDELSYDQFHTKSNRIYRIWDEMSTRQVAVTPYKWGRYIKDEFPEVENYTTAQQLDIVVKRDISLFNESQVFAVDSTFLEVFDFPVLAGDRNNLLNGANQVVLSPVAAKKYFGNSNPMGETLEINLFGKMDLFIVSGGG